MAKAKKKLSPRLTEEQKQEIKRLGKAGKTIKEIAQELKVTEFQVRHSRKQAKKKTKKASAPVTSAPVTSAPAKVIKAPEKKTGSIGEIRAKMKELQDAIDRHEKNMLEIQKLM